MAVASAHATSYEDIKSLLDQGSEPAAIELIKKKQIMPGFLPQSFKNIDTNGSEIVVTEQQLGQSAVRVI